MPVLCGGGAINAAVDRDREALLEDIAIVAWLRGEPYYRSALLALVNAERPRRGATYAGIEGVDEEALEEERRYAERYASTARWGPCARCLGGPVLTFVDGSKLDWPGMSLHECAPTGEPSRRALPPRQLAAGGRR